LFRHSLRGFDVLHLRALVTAAKQHNQRLATPYVVQAIAWAEVDPKLAYAPADGFDVAEIAERQAAYADENLRPGALVFQILEP
jgi:hypothetical protein